MIREKPLSIVILLLLVLVGCQRGCTTSSTMDRENVVVNINGHEVKIIARVVDYRNSKRINRNIFNRKVTHTYGLSIDVSFNGLIEKGVYTEGVSDPDKVDLNAELKRVKIALSKDLNHLAVGMDNIVADVIHIYKNKRIVMSSSPNWGGESMKWSDLNIESFHTPEQLLIEDVRFNCLMAGINSEQIVDVLDNSSPADSAHRILLSKWPECKLAEDYYTAKRVHKFSKNKVWKKWAEDRGEKVFSESFFGSKEDVYTFIEALNSAKLNASVDSFIADSWGSKMDQETTQMVIQRIQGKAKPFTAEIKDLIIKDAQFSFAKFMSSGNSDYKREAASCLHVLIASGDTATSGLFLRDAFGVNNKNYDVFDFIEVAYDNYNIFTKKQKQFILDKTSNLFMEIKDYARQTLFRSVVDIFDCKQLRTWKKEYAKDLQYADLPDGC